MLAAAMQHKSHNPGNGNRRTNGGGGGTDHPAPLQQSKTPSVGSGSRHEAGNSPPRVLLPRSSQQAPLQFRAKLRPRPYREQQCGKLSREAQERNHRQDACGAAMAGRVCGEGGN